MLAAVSAPAAAQRYDLLITNGAVIDGTGALRFRADVAVSAGRVVALSRTPLARSRATRVIDAAGLVVAPGFIDLHAHLDPILNMPDAESHVRQGVTLALGGPDGGGPWPFKPYLDSVAARPLGMNVAFLAGHNTIRSAVMGTENRAPTPAELSRMEAMVAQSMGEGAFGMSTGLRYIPGFYSNTDEVVALSKVAGDSGGIYTSHLREEGVGLLEGVAEALEIGRRAHIPVVLTHHKAIGRLMWGKSVVTLAMVDSARRAGTDVMIDQYPYTASSTSLDVLVPPWALAGGRSQLAQRLANPQLKDSITKGVIEYLLNDRGGGDLKRVQFARVSWDKTLEGKTLYDLTTRRNLAPTPENAAPLVLESVLKGGASMVFHVIDEGDVKRIMAHPMTMIASDGRLTRLGDGVPHPRNYGTFPRVIGHYVRDEHVLTLEQAVRKMTGMPAARLGLKDHGCISEGCVADITLFNPATVRDVGTFEDPHHYPEGIPYVIVNGAVVVDNGKFTAARPGKVIKRPPRTTGLPAAARPEDVGLSSAGLARIAPALQTLVDSGKMPGAVIAVAHHGKVALLQSVGRMELGGVPMRTDAVFRIYSMTKPIVGAAIMRLVDQGKVRLSAGCRADAQRRAPHEAAPARAVRPRRQ
jgi:N-acyl-D-amino-acid deacylase